MLHISPQDSAEYLNILDSIRSLYLCASIEFADTGAYLGLSIMYNGAFCENS